MRRRWIAGLLLLGLLCSLAGCGAARAEKKLTVVAAIFPEYDWARQILGDDPDITLRLLVDDGVDPHSFQPTVGDMVTVSGCDLLIFGGGESDEWLEDVIAEAVNPNQLVLELMPLLGERLHSAELVEGMQVREAEEETDEHVWLSLRNAALCCQAIADALCRINPKNAATYHANLEPYLRQLNALDEAYRTAIAGSEKDTILLCDRFPFRYLVEDYGLHYYAAFPGCSAESGASFATIVFLADKVRALELDAVLVLEGNDGRIARTVAENSGRGQVTVLTLDSMQSVSIEDAAGRDYLGIMEKNLEVLKEALG